MSELAARVGGGEEKLDGASGKGGCLTGLAEVSQCSDGSDGSVALFLAETVNGVRLCFELSRLLERIAYRASATAARRAMRTVCVYILMILSKLAQSWKRVILK